VDKREEIRRACITVACVSISRLVQISAWSAVLGVATLAAAVAFWSWGRVMIGPLGVRRLPDEPPLQLQRTGAFGIVRRPLHFGYLLAAAAPLALLLRPLHLLTFALSFIALAVRAVQEERRLRTQLGPAYDAYCAEVKRLIPFVW
jgi:protein-S-isoprenylcysteine O-methyltransferase Ste14